MIVDSLNAANSYAFIPSLTSHHVEVTATPLLMTEGTAHSFWIIAPGEGEIRRQSLPSVGPNEVLVRTLYSAISRGTESLVFSGQVPESEYQRMKAPFQEGNFPAPVKYGYSNVGVVEEGPPQMRDRTVFCLYPHQTHYVVPIDAVYGLPEEVPPERAVLAANLETAVNGLWDAGPRIGDRIAVVGAGTLGCLVAWLAGQMPICSVQLVDVDCHKARVATALAVDFATPDRASAEADLVVHTSGVPEGLETALRLAAFEAHIVEMSWFGSRRVGLPLGQDFHARRLTLRSSQVGTVATSQRARWNARRRMQLALQLLQRDPALDCLVSAESPFQELPEVMARVTTNPQGTLCHRIAYS